MSKNKVIYYLISLICVAVIIFLINTKFTTGPSVENSPQMYEFLLFPKGNPQVYSDESFSKPIGILDRATGASFQEINDGIVGVNFVTNTTRTYGFIKADSLAYLPENNNPQFVEKWKELYLSEWGIEGDWTAKDKGNGIYAIEYKTEDDKHIRSYTYSYLTDGSKLIKVSPYKSTNGFILALEFFIFFVLFIAVLLFGKFLFRNRASA